MYHCRPNVARPVVHPTKYCENHSFSKTIVPHIHPQHVTNVNHHKYEHVHYYPTSYSKYDPVTHHHSHCGKPCDHKGYW
ncbi:CotD family spore coat protein [Bacillus sonorensis]|nr:MULTISPECIES: CotD family spore coat protein [Bacillus]ASB88896.1 Spore coat protein [Bacillus sonorensis]MCF7618245.1 spore coat protein [Bacillus sonorensis]MCY7856965.1 spore coat protein [Bacillus sonorensis]MCY8024524.1 spore coat protein [Bacillus sonorensis]MCY8035882.1 spore coat protein [Bacillus sonorensis]